MCCCALLLKSASGELLHDSHCAAGVAHALHAYRSCDPDPAVRPASRTAHADRYLSRHPHSRDRGGVELRGPAPDDMAGRIIYYYERTLDTVNDIEHIESQSLPGIGIVKIFFQPGVDIRTATAQVTSVSQTVLKQMPPGITPPLILNYNASTVPILQLALSSPQLAEQKLVDSARTSSARRWRPCRARRFRLPTAARPARSRSTSTRKRCKQRASPPRTSKTPSPRRTRSFRPAPQRSAGSNTTSS